MKTLPSLLVIHALAFACPLLAQSPADGRHAHAGSQRGPWSVRAMDTDHNGELSAAEIAQAGISIRGLDTDDDGNLTVDELMPIRHGASRRAPSADAVVRSRPLDLAGLALDANADGIISAMEIANATRSLQTLDTNRDGALTADELRPVSFAAQ